MRRLKARGPAYGASAGLVHRAKTRIPDDRYLTEWTAVIAARLETVD
jgi:hypothetical protein